MGSVPALGRGQNAHPGGLAAGARTAPTGPRSVGIRRRVAAPAGTVAVSSPVGGPTVIDVLLPCVW